MRYDQQGESVRLLTWLELNVTAATTLLTVTVLIGTVATLAAGLGKPETVALFVLAGIVVVLLGLTLVRLSEHLRTNGLALPE